MEVEPAGLKTVDRALSVLELVAGSQEPPSVRDVATALGHNVSSTYHLINTLVGRGYLEKDGAELRIGARVGILYAALTRSSDLARQMRPILERLAAECDETVYLTELVGDRVVIRTVIEGAQSLRVTGLAVGYSGSEDRRASGLIVMAFLDAEGRDAILQRLYAGLAPDETRARRERLDAQLEAARSKGYAFDDQNFSLGILGLAAPIFGPSGGVHGSLTVTAPTVREEKLLGPVREAVLRAADDVSAELHAPPAIREAWRAVAMR